MSLGCYNLRVLPLKVNVSLPDPLSTEVVQLRAVYDPLRRSLERLAINIRQALEGFIEEAGIPYLTITYRIKAFESFAQKIERKGYGDPYEQCEDLCGVRIICYYPSDVERIAALIRSEFDVKEAIDKAALLGVREFGYRSTHLIAMVKPAWLAAPNYRGLGQVKAEIQIRTVLMHAWAEIEHKLAYKSVEQVPDPFRRKLSRLSAKFEEADEQFEELRKGLADYRTGIAERAVQAGRFDSSLPMNIDTLQAYLSYYFPDRRENGPHALREALAEISQASLTMANLMLAYERAHSVLKEYERNMRPFFKTQTGQYAQLGALRAILDLTQPGYAERRIPANLRNEEMVKVSLGMRDRFRLGAENA
jgi:ppGpp synthetase/RelA/SpoT-type nucleotidyltranferase